MLDVVRTILLNDSGIDALNLNGVFIDESQRGTQPPYIVLKDVDGEPNDTKNSTSDVDQLILGVYAYGEKTYTKDGTIGAKSVMDDVRAALDAYRGTVNGSDIHLRAYGTPQVFADKIANKQLKGCEQEFEVYLNTSIASSSYANLKLVYETSDFSTGNGWNHIGTVSVTADQDGSADLVDFGGNGYIQRPLGVSDGLAANSDYLITCDIKNATALADSYHILRDTDGKDWYQTSPLLRFYPQQFSDYKTVSLQTITDSGAAITFVIQENGPNNSLNGDNAFYIKNFRIYKLTFNG